MKNRFDQLMNPLPGSALQAAREFGVDLTLLYERLKLTPEERLRDLQRVMSALERMRQQASASLDRYRKDAATSGKQ